MNETNVNILRKVIEKTFGAREKSEEEKES